MTATPHLTFRILERNDGKAYQQLRLEALATNPEAFLSTLAAEELLHEDAFADHLDQTYHPPHLGYYGAFTADQLVGYVQISSTFLEKQRHIVYLNNLYVSKAIRHQGVGEQLLDHVFAELQHAGVERVFLSCTAQNRVAQHFYRSLGFRRCGLKVRAIKWQDRYDDEIDMVKIFIEPTRNS